MCEEWLGVMEVVDPGYSPAKAPVIEVITIIIISIIIIMTMKLSMMTMRIMFKSMTQELAGAKMQLLRRKQEECGKVRLIIWKPDGADADNGASADVDGGDADYADIDGANGGDASH